SKTGFISQTLDNISVNADQTTTANFYLAAGSDNIDVLAAITATKLAGNFPNPFNPQTTISFTIKEPETVRLEIYNLKGQLVRSLLNGHFATGYYNLVWDGKDNSGDAVGSGIYYYRMRTADYSCTKKMLLME
ncbi:MAG: FlgD immunoglobulin-like domain containing protein, partial [Candidatus Cloacimonetes bacterium]|nr:FlgD immunoglobulin-like domain containing protein [Candidatus Cloacimonadota bacterium]